MPTNKMMKYLYKLMIMKMLGKGMQTRFFVIVLHELFFIKNTAS